MGRQHVSISTLVSLNESTQQQSRLWQGLDIFCDYIFILSLRVKRIIMYFFPVVWIVTRYKSFSHVAEAQPVAAARPVAACPAIPGTCR